MPLFKNAQWIVEHDGMSPVETLPPYDIAIDRVFETTNRGSQTFYDWPVHMAVKTWVDVPSFIEAFDCAIHHYSNVSGKPVDEEMLQASYAEALRAAARRG